MDPPPWQPYRESFRTTLLRTVSIAAIIGAILAASRHDLARWPRATLLALWPTLGGHFVEVWFLNWLRPRLPRTRMVQTVVRLATWFVGGALLALALNATAIVLNLRAYPWPTFWLVGGVAFIALEMFVHLVLLARRRPNFYDGLG